MQHNFDSSEHLLTAFYAFLFMVIIALPPLLWVLAGKKWSRHSKEEMRTFWWIFGISSLVIWGPSLLMEMFTLVTFGEIPGNNFYNSVRLIGRIFILAIMSIFWNIPALVMLILGNKKARTPVKESAGI